MYRCFILMVVWAALMTSDVGCQTSRRWPWVGNAPSAAGAVATPQAKRSFGDASLDSEQVTASGAVESANDKSPAGHELPRSTWLQLADTATVGGSVSEEYYTSGDAATAASSGCTSGCCR